tara:strand:- start:162 stop:335 length:174 start_codon:yes stop_codon:yes gene_type:complete
MSNDLRLARKTYSKYEINAMDSIYKAIDKFEALGITTENLYRALNQIPGRFEDVTEK